jgi:cytochrome c
MRLMTKAFILLAALAACQPVVLPPTGVSSPEAMRGDPTRGLDVADRNCSLCHAIAPTGDSPHPKAPAFRTLGSRYPLAALSEALAEGIVVGHAGMPQIQLEPQKIDDLIAYLETLQPPATTRPK